MNYISLSIEKEPGLFKEHLKIELTLDGEKYLSENTDATLMDLFGENGRVGRYILTPDMEKIYTEEEVRYESEPLVHLEFYNNCMEDVIEQLKSSFCTGPAYFEHDEEGNKERTAIITAKKAADAWAVYSPEKLDIAAITIGQRHNTLAKGIERVREVLNVFEYNEHKQDDVYGNKLNEVLAEIEKELDYNTEKMRLVSVISKNNFNIQESVSRVYRKFRDVDEDKNKEKYNLKITDDGISDIPRDIQEQQEDLPKESDSTTNT